MRFSAGWRPRGTLARVSNVFEFSAPVSTIVAAVGNTGSTHPVTTIAPNWTIYMALDATSASPDNDWGRDIVTDAGALNVLTPEPSTMAMLIGASLALLGLALRRRS